MAAEESSPQFDKASADQREFVVRTIMSVIANAEADADRVAALLKRMGHKSRARTATEPRPVHPAAREALLLLAAAIRLRQWERSGLTARLPSHLPSSADAIEATSKIASQSPPSSIPLLVFRNWHQHFAHNASAELGADVLITPMDHVALIRELAAFLWRRQSIIKGH